MRVAISQPEHFPYLGFFQKMASANVFVLLDCVQFQGKGSFQVRNWMWNKQGQKEWFTLHTPKSARHCAIKDVPLLDGQSWRRRYREKLSQNLNFDVSDWLETDRLLDVNLRGIELGRRCFGIQTPLVLSSTLEITGQKSQRVVNICRALGATSYLTGPGALDYLDRDVFGALPIECFTPQVRDYTTFLSHRHNPEWLWSP